MESTLIIGGRGSIGRRYVSIMRYLGKPYKVVDIDKNEAMEDGTIDLTKFNFTHAIVATPTDTHFKYCKNLIEMNKIFLCEKPLSKNPEECESISEYTNGYVVNNYEWAIRHIMAPHTISYDYFKTGNDGIFWDCCQILQLDPKAKIKNDSPIWKLTINENRIHYNDFERAYIWMISAFHTQQRLGLWSLKTGLRMTQKVLERIK